MVEVPACFPLTLLFVLKDLGPFLDGKDGNGGAVVEKPACSGHPSGSAN